MTSRVFNLIIITAALKSTKRVLQTVNSSISISNQHDIINQMSKSMPL